MTCVPPPGSGIVKLPDCPTRLPISIRALTGKLGLLPGLPNVIALRELPVPVALIVTCSRPGFGITDSETTGRGVQTGSSRGAAIATEGAIANAEIATTATNSRTMRETAPLFPPPLVLHVRAVEVVGESKDGDDLVDLLPSTESEVDVRPIPVKRQVASIPVPS